MTESDGTAVRVELLINIDAQILAYRNGLSRKSLISLDDIEVLDLVAALCHSLAGSCHGADTHYLGTNTCKSACHEGSHRLNAQLLSLLLAHDHDSCRTVIDTGCVACGNKAVGIEGLKLLKALDGGTGTGSLILIEDDGLLLLLDLNGNDLLIESTVLLGCTCLLLALERELVKLLAGQASLACHIVSGGDHMVIVECIPESILYHGIHKAALAL